MARWLGGILVLVAVATVEAAPFAWIAHDSSSWVSRIDLATHEALLVPVGASPDAVAATRDGLRAYVANTLDGTVTVVDAPTATVVTTVTVGGSPSGIAVTNDGAKVYVTTGADVVVIDTASAAVVDTIPVGGTLVTAVMNPAGTRLYVTKVDSGRSVAVIDTATDAVTADVLVPGSFSYSYGLAVSPDGTRVYVAALIASEVDVIDATTNLAIAPIPLSGSFVTPAAVAVSPAGDRVYVAEYSTNQVAVLDPVTGTELTTVPVGSNPRSVDVTPDGTRVYVANNGDASLSIIDPATNTNVGTVLTLEPFPLSLGRFIAPGTTTTTTSTSSTSTSSPTPTTSTTTSSTTTSTSTLPPPPLLSGAALVCQKTLALSFKRFGAKAHGVFVTCFQRFLAEVAGGGGTTDAAAACVADLDPGVPTAKIVRLRTAARSQILARCGSVAPAELELPCDPGATTFAAVADCVLDRQVARVSEAIAAEYGRPCSIATGAGLAGIYPGLCP